MPNHVDMDLTVVGDTESLLAFIDFAKEDKIILSANKFIPYPEEYKKLDALAEEQFNKGNYAKDGFNSGGYEWCVKHWGTKWGIYSASLISSKLDRKRGSLKYNCKSAWEPPIPVIYAMSNKFPSLKFSLKYYERGTEYKGTFVISGGYLFKDERTRYRGPRGG